MCIQQQNTHSVKFSNRTQGYFQVFPEVIEFEIIEDITKHSTDTLTWLMDVLKACCAGVRFAPPYGACKYLRSG